MRKILTFLQSAVAAGLLYCALIFGSLFVVRMFSQEVTEQACERSIECIELEDKLIEHADKRPSQKYLVDGKINFETRQKSKFNDVGRVLPERLRDLTWGELQRHDSDLLVGLNCSDVLDLHEVGNTVVKGVMLRTRRIYDYQEFDMSFEYELEAAEAIDFAKTIENATVQFSIEKAAELIGERFAVKTEMSQKLLLVKTVKSSSVFFLPNTETGFDQMAIFTFEKMPGSFRGVRCAENGSIFQSGWARMGYLEF